MRTQKATVTRSQLDRPPSLKPLELGGSSLLGRRCDSHDQADQSAHHGPRRSISTPQSSHRLEINETQRASLVPRKLGPVVLREPATPVRRLSSSRMGAVKRDSYRSSRGTPFQRCQHPNTTAPLAGEARPSERHWATVSPKPESCTSAASMDSPTLEQRVDTLTVSTRSSLSSLQPHTAASNASPATTRPSGERNRLKRKRSRQSLRRPYAESGGMDLDKEVLELNTIVEERRAEVQRAWSPHHIPAVAPSLKVRARSETLNDIGSAFARPQTARDSSRLEDVFETSGDIPKRPSTSRVTSRSSSRVSGWLSGLLPAQSAPIQTQEPFYKCIPPARWRPLSETSLCTSVTELDSPSLTVASSPTSKGHSRSLTAESRLTPISPLSTFYGQGETDRKKEAEEHWPIVMTMSQVGLAL